MSNFIKDIPGQLEPGDILLYNSHDITDAVIRWKESDPDTAHVEVYIGNYLSVVARNGLTVDSYQFRTSGLVHVRRPTNAFNLVYAMPWFREVKGAPYGWSDILANAGLIEQPMDAWTKTEVLVKAGMDCSHFASLFLWKGFAAQFDMAFDQRLITPRDFKTSIASQPIWDWTNTDEGAAAKLRETLPHPGPLPLGEGELKGRATAEAGVTAPLLSPRAEGEAQP